MKMPPRELPPGQRCRIWVHDTSRGENSLLFDTTDILLEAPNWTLQGDALILNGDGTLWRLPIDHPALLPIALTGVPPLNNDHVLDPDGTHIFVSTYDDWHIYRAPLAGGAAMRITGESTPDGMLHFLHGVSPDGRQLAFVGVRADFTETGFRFRSAEICTLGTDGKNFDQITSGGVPADGPEYSPDGKWLYFNTEAFSGHAQVARMRPDGSCVERLSQASTVDWFPHLSPDGKTAVYLAYPPGTSGHPENRWVELKVVRDGDWTQPVTVARLFGGQGTINVNSWSPDNTRFAYVTYPMDTGA
jgi:TolB protein